MDRSRRFRQSQPTPTSDSAPALPGTDFAYEVTRTELSRTHKRITRIDAIAGILVGILTAATGGFIAVHLSTITRVIVVIPLLASITLTAACLLITEVEDGPHPRGVAEMVDQDPDQIRAALVPLLLDANDATAAQAHRKERLLRLAFALTLVGAIVALVAGAVRG